MLQTPRWARCMRAAVIAALVAALGACATSPTGRTQLKLFPEDQMAKMGAASYQQLKKKTPSSNDPQVNSYVRCVANSITQVVDSDADWEVTVFKDDTPNAFALPGGKIGVHTGLLDVAKNQAQLAAVIGHEIGHVKADHGNARVSAQYATQAGLTVAQIAAGAYGGGQQQQLIGLLGAGAQVGILLPYGRSQESEADILGLDYMARAGFNPRESVDLWKNMAEAGGDQPPEFLSTHPSHGSRIDTLKEHMPEALDTYQQAQAQGRTPDCG